MSTTPLLSTMNGMNKEEAIRPINPNESEEQDDKENEVKVVVKKKKGWSRFFITIEPIKFCMGLTIALTGGVTIDLLQRNACHRDYNLTFTECTSSNISSEIKVNVEASTAQANMAINIIQGICPVVLVLFIGPWSDVNGRKPFILFALRGYLIYYSLWMMFSFFPYIPVIWFFIPSIPLGLSGALIAIFVCTWSYTCDNFRSEERTMRFTLSVAALVTGNVIGNSLADEILYLGGDYGFQAVFSIAFFVTLTAIFYTRYFLEETVICEGKKGKLFEIKHVTSIIDAVILRPTKGRLVVTFVLLVLATEIPAYAGDDAMAYLIGKSQYNWSLAKYNLFAALGAFMAGIGPVIGVWLMMDLCGLKNQQVLVITSSLLIVLQLLKAMSVNETMFWIVALSAKSSCIIGACIDSELVDSVSENNAGKAFTFTTLVVALSPLIAIPIYTQVYTILLSTSALYVYFLSFGINVITFTASVGLLVKTRSEYIQSPTSPPIDE